MSVTKSSVILNETKWHEESSRSNPVTRLRDPSMPPPFAQGYGGAKQDDNLRTCSKDFPIFANRAVPFVYLDSAATSQKPQIVVDAMADFLTKHNANVHRGIYSLSEEATELYETARAKIATFINAPATHEIIFTGNTNEAINLVAFGWARKFLHKGDIVVLTEMEHHANILPWQHLRDEIGIKLHWLPLTTEYRLDYQSLQEAQLDFSRIGLVTLTHVSNVLGTINPIADIVTFLRSLNIDAKVLVDAAQSVPHLPVDVTALGVDFLVFSGHKMLGPSGIGVLWAKSALLETMDPLFVGSHMITTVTKESATFSELPWKFEVGTGKLEAAVGLGTAVDYLSGIGFDQLESHEQELTEYGLEQLLAVPGLALFGPVTANDRLAIFSFSLAGIHPHDVAQILDRDGICVRSGHHCAQPLMNTLGVPATTRASAYLYNTKKDIDSLVAGLENVRKTFG